MEEACDLAAKHIKSRPNKKAMYWWCDAVAEARRLCIAANRKRRRARRRGPFFPDDILEVEYRAAKQCLCSKIRKAKSRAWDELISSIDKDPWGLPYKIVLNRLRHSTPGFTETLDEETLSVVLNSLFPAGIVYDPIEL